MIWKANWKITILIIDIWSYSREFRGPIKFIFMSTVISILVIVLGFVGYKYIYPCVSKTIERMKIEGLNQYMGRQVLHIEESESTYCYCWDVNFAIISDSDYKKCCNIVLVTI